MPKYWQLRQAIRQPQYLFLNNRGGRLSMRSIRRTLNKYLLKAGLGLGISVHSLKYNFAGLVEQPKEKKP